MLVLGVRQQLRHDLHRVAAGQAGFFTAAQALEVGYSYQAQKYNLDAQNWLRVDRGVFRVASWPTGLHDDLVRWVLWSKHRAVVSHDSAAGAHRLGVLNPAKIHLTVPAGFRKKHDLVSLHRGDVPPDDVITIDGAAITSVARTVLDIVRTQFDEELIENVMRDALETGAFTRGHLERHLDTLKPKTRARALRVMNRVEQ